MDIEELYEALRKSWSRDTCYQEIIDGWSVDNLAFGQCYITALIVNDYFGGEILKAKLSNGLSHYWNLIDGQEVDLTRSQFKSGEIIPKPVKIERINLQENERYNILKSRIMKLYGKN